MATYGYSKCKNTITTEVFTQLTGKDYSSGGKNTEMTYLMMSNIPWY